MKTHVEPWRIIIKDIDDALRNARDFDLPLKSIELTHSEWDNFIDAFIDWKVARSLLRIPPRSDLAWVKHIGETYYRGVKIYRGTE